METLLRTAETRDGRPLAIRRVLAPDADWAGRILPFLGHKGELWRWQLDQFLTRRFEPLAFRCYLADLAEGGAPPRVAGTICTIEARDVGLFGHVFTDPAHRGRSIARLLTEATVNDFHSRGGVALWLVTGHDSTPFRVYRQFGFDSIQPGDGIMAWFAEGGRAELERRFAPGRAVRTRPMDWSDYATLNALSCAEEGPPQRSTALRAVGRNIVEESFLALKRTMRDNLHIQAQVLACEDGWPVGWAICRPAAGQWAPRQEPRPPMMLDLYAHPNYEQHYHRLLASIRLPAEQKILAVIDSCCPARRAALAEAGFTAEGRLTDVFRWRERAVDLLLMAQGPA